MTFTTNTFRRGDLVVHRTPNTPADGGVLFGSGPRHVAAVTTDGVHVTIDGNDALFFAGALNFAPGTAVTDPLGRHLIVVREVEPAPSRAMTRVVKTGAREWVPTDLLTAVPTEPEIEVWGTRAPGRSIQWWGDEFTARHAAPKGPNVEVLTMTGRPTVVGRSPSAGQHALVDLDELRRAAAAGPSALATFVSRVSEKGDFLTEVEEALSTPAGIQRLIADRRGTAD
jgi:hypothetical protein